MAQTRTSIIALPRGHEFEPTTFVVSRAQRDAYLAATADATHYGDAVPPLAAVALGLAALQEQISLPDGALHTGQEVEHHAVLPADTLLTLHGRIAQRSERQGMVISVLEFEIGSGEHVAIRARTTIIAPGGSQS